jgi:uncharacterized Rmd1/YagE family protein
MKVFSPHIALYRLFDLADEIDLSRLAIPRLRLSRPRLGAVRYETPPAQIELGVRSVEERLRVLEATYAMVAEEAVHLRSQAVEVGILALIAFEVLRALL